MSGESLAQCLAAFAKSDYARQTCEYCNANPADYGQIGGIFEKVRLDGNTLDVKLKYNFEQKSEQLMEQLKRHLRREMPVIKRLTYAKGTTMMTKIISA